MQQEYTKCVEARISAIPDMYGMRNEWLSVRLDDLKARDRRKTKSGLARKLGVRNAAVWEIIDGTRRIQSTEVTPMADYLEWPQEVLLAHLGGGAVEPAALSAVMVRGAVQAGVWSEANEWPPERWYPAMVAADRRYARFEQFALEVRGPSMNEVYTEGSVVICVPFLLLGRDAKPPERVIVQRRKHDEFEATVKELRQDEKGAYWLWPRSTDPNFQQPWPLVEDATGNENLRIIALVIGSYRPE